MKRTTLSAVAVMQRSATRALLFAGLLLSGAQAHAQAGNAGMAFLKLGVSGRGIAMGEAMSAIANAAGAAHYNPAGVLAPGNGTTQFLLMHREWIQDVRTQFLGASVQLDDDNALGVAINTTTVSDIEIRTRPGTAEGSFTSRDFSFGIAYARRLSDHLKLGLGAKFLFEKIFVDEATGFAVDLGAQYRTPVEGLYVGLGFANLGSVSAMRNEKLTLPSLLRAGPAFSLQLEDLNSRLTSAADIVYVFPEKRATLGFGTEILFNNLVALRAGYQPGTHARGFSGGIGVQYNLFALDYAIIPLSANLGSGHAVTLTITF